jgi:anhydro-N-acetylmuramic acid kinase
LNALPYYSKPYPKSLANEFGTETVLPMIREVMGGPGAGGANSGLRVEDALCTYVEHIAIQIRCSAEMLLRTSGEGGTRASEGLAVGTYSTPVRMLVTGGGAHNGF